MKNINEEYLDSLLGEELEKGKKQVEAAYSDVREYNKLPSKIIDRMVRSIEHGDDPEGVGTALISVLIYLSGKGEIADYLSHFIFEQTISCLSFWDERTVEKGDRAEYSFAIEVLKMAAVKYFLIQGEKKIESLDLPKKLRLLKQELFESPKDKYEFKYKALIILQEKFEAELEHERVEIEARKNLVSDITKSHRKKTKASESTTFPLSTRQIVMLILSLMYGNPNVPDGLTKSDVVSFIESFSELDFANVGKYVGNPIGAKPESIKERKARIKDLRTVASRLKALGVNRGRWKEIDEKIKLLEDEIHSIKDFTEDN